MIITFPILFKLKIYKDYSLVLNVEQKKGMPIGIPFLKNMIKLELKKLGIHVGPEETD